MLIIIFPNDYTSNKKSKSRAVLKKLFLMHHFQTGSVVFGERRETLQG